MICGDKMDEKLVEIGTFFDFYGGLLTERQYSAIKLYYIHDLSLAEIGEELNITRQGVFDTLKRGEQNLYKFEVKLSLVEKFHSNNASIKKIIDHSESIIECLNHVENMDKSEDIKNNAILIKKISNDILNNNQGV